MIESIAERVLCIIQSRLAGILSADGYWTSAGRNVRRAQRTLDEDDLPALVIWCDGETARGASGNSASMDVELQITIDAHVSADQDCTGKMLERIRADVKRACLVGRGALSDEVGAVGVLTYTGTDMQARSDGAGSEAVAVRFTASYREAYGDPTQAR